MSLLLFPTFVLATHTGSLLTVVAPHGERITPLEDWRNVEAFWFYLAAHFFLILPIPEWKVALQQCCVIIFNRARRRLASSMIII